MIECSRRRLFFCIFDRFGGGCEKISKKSNICVDKPNICAIIRDRKNKCSEILIKEETKMTTAFVLISVLEVAAVALVIVGFIFEKKVIAFEEACEDKLARRIAGFLLSNKYTKDAFKKENVNAQRRAEAEAVSAPETSSPTPTRKGSSRVA